MDEALIDRLRADLENAGYRVDAVTELLGRTADGARRRGVFSPARRALESQADSPLATLVQVFLLGESVPSAVLDAALPNVGAEGATALGLVAEDGAGSGAHLAALSLNPEVTGTGESQREWWILSDLDDQLRRGPARPDHVMGVGGATRSLIAQAPTDMAETALDLGGAEGPRSLDLGTGCGIVALHLAAQTSGRVVATDISERALMLARANARLNSVDTIDFRQGDLFAPVAGECFELILSNPPFVITPRVSDAPVYEYRDGGLVGDELAERVVREGPAHLADGGTLLCLANWESRPESHGLDRARGWVAAASATAGPLSAWVIERDLVDPEHYAETWVRDGGARAGSPEFEAVLDAWLDDFAAREVSAIGLGSVRVRREAEGNPVIRTEQATGPFDPDPGTALQQAFVQGAACERMIDAEVLQTRWVRCPGVSEVREHHPGEEGPRAINLTSERGIYRRIHADTLLAAAVGACDGELSLEQIADALATILELDQTEVAAALTAHTRELTWLGMLTAQPR